GRRNRARRRSAWRHHLHRHHRSRRTLARRARRIRRLARAVADRILFREALVLRTALSAYFHRRRARKSDQKPVILSRNDAVGPAHCTPHLDPLPSQSRGEEAKKSAF